MWFDEEDLNPRDTYRVTGQVFAAGVILAAVFGVLALSYVLIEAVRALWVSL